MNTKENKKNKSKSLITSAMLIIIIAAGAYKFDDLSAYFLNLKNNHYSAGDKIYASEKFLKNQRIH